MVTYYLPFIIKIVFDSSQFCIIRINTPSIQWHDSSTLTLKTHLCLLISPLPHHIAFVRFSSLIEFIADSPSIRNSPRKTNGVATDEVLASVLHTHQP